MTLVIAIINIVTTSVLLTAAWLCCSWKRRWKKIVLRIEKMLRTMQKPIKINDLWPLVSSITINRSNSLSLQTYLYFVTFHTFLSKGVEITLVYFLHKYPDLYSHRMWILAPSVMWRLWPEEEGCLTPLCAQYLFIHFLFWSWLL